MAQHCTRFENSLENSKPRTAVRKEEPKKKGK